MPDNGNVFMSPVVDGTIYVNYGSVQAWADNVDGEIAALSTETTQIDAKINAAVTAREDGDDALRARLATEEAARSQGDADEAIARAQGDAALGQSLTAEASARASGDNAAASDREAIRNDFAAADAILRGGIDAATTDRAAIRDALTAGDSAVRDLVPRAATEGEVFRGSTEAGLYVTPRDALALGQAALRDLQQVSAFSLLGATYTYGETGYYLSQYSLAGPHGPAPTLDPIDQRFLATAYGTKAVVIPPMLALSPKLSFGVLDDAVYEITYAAGRTGDTSDPNGDSLRFGIAWLDGSESDAGIAQSETTIEDVVATVADGRIVRTVYIGPVAGAVVPPAGAVRWRPFVRNYGSGGRTVATVLRIRDVTERGIVTGDIADITNRVGALEGANILIGATGYTLDTMPPGTATLTDPTGENAAGLLPSDVMALRFGVDDQTGAQLIGEVVGGEPRLYYRALISGTWRTPMALASEDFVQSAVNDLAQSVAGDLAAVGAGSNQIVPFDTTTGNSSHSLARRNGGDEAFMRIYTGAQTTAYIGQFGSDNLAVGVGNAQGGTLQALRIHAGTGAVELMAENVGTWSPTLSAGAAPSGVTYGHAEGWWRRIGDLVECQYSIQIDSMTGGSGLLRILGAPFAPVAGRRFGGTVAIDSLGSGMTLPSGGLCLACYDLGGEAVAFIHAQGSADLVNVTPAALAFPCRVFGAFSYQATPATGYSA